MCNVITYTYVYVEDYEISKLKYLQYIANTIAKIINRYIAIMYRNVCTLSTVAHKAKCT